MSENTNNNPQQHNLNIFRTVLIGLGFFACQFAWGMYNFHLPRILAGVKIGDDFFRIGFSPLSCNFLTSSALTLSMVLFIWAIM